MYQTLVCEVTYNGKTNIRIYYVFLILFAYIKLLILLVVLRTSVVVIP